MNHSNPITWYIKLYLTWCSNWTNLSRRKMFTQLIRATCPKLLWQKAHWRIIWNLIKFTKTGTNQSRSQKNIERVTFMELNASMYHPWLKMVDFLSKTISLFDNGSKRVKHFVRTWNNHSSHVELSQIFYSRKINRLRNKMNSSSWSSKIETCLISHKIFWHKKTIFYNKTYN